MAVTVYLKDIHDLPENISVTEILECSKYPERFNYAYEMIRQELSFLSKLEHPHLIKLCGVRTYPYMCLVTERAPLMSLRESLKEYKKCDVSLQPLTVKVTAFQV